MNYQRRWRSGGCDRWSRTTYTRKVTYLGPAVTSVRTPSPLHQVISGSGTLPIWQVKVTQDPTGAILSSTGTRISGEPGCGRGSYRTCDGARELGDDLRIA